MQPVHRDPIVGLQSVAAAFSTWRAHTRRSLEISHLKPEERGKQDHPFSGNSDIFKFLLRQTGKREKVTFIFSCQKKFCKCYISTKLVRFLPIL